MALTGLESGPHENIYIDTLLWVGQRGLVMLACCLGHRATIPCPSPSHLGVENFDFWPDSSTRLRDREPEPFPAAVCP